MQKRGLAPILDYAVAVAPAPVHVLNFQRDFQCRHSGACCTAGWHIPVEPRTLDALAQAQRDGRFHVAGYPPADGPEAWVDTREPPEGAAGILRTGANGACICFEPDRGRLCAIQRQVGHDALPSACRQFPRVTLVDDRGAHVALSHYCPTVAAMLVGSAGVAADIVCLPPGHPGRREADGFDARGAVPPFVRSGVAFDMASHDAWERAIVRALGHPAADADARLALVAAAAEDLRGWTPARGAMVDEVSRITGALNDRLWRERAAVTPDAPGTADTADITAIAGLFDTVAASVPADLPRPACPPDLADSDRLFVAPVWTALSLPVGRFLAAKAFASPVAWQGEGLRTQVMALAAARAVLRVELARLAGAARRPADEAIVIGAARAADALIEHLSDRPSLVRRWASVESLPRAAFLQGLGLGARA